MLIQSKVQKIASGGLIMSLEKFGLILYFNFLQKKYLGCQIKPNFSKDIIRPPLVIFSAFLKKITTTKWTGLIATQCI